MKQQVIISEKLEQSLEQAIASCVHDKLFILTDEMTHHLCLPLIQDYSCMSGFCEISIGATDEHKNLETLAAVWTALGTAGATRHSLLINLGGGMVTDLGGFAASTFKRGIAYINVPTTLLAMVDASVGGKTGINFNGLKNEIGRLLDSSAIEKEPLKNRIFEYASLIYQSLDITQRITEMIRATLQRTRSLSCYNGELTAKIAAAITLHADKAVSLTLKNGQQIRKEKNDATDSTHTAKESTHHCSDYTAGECAQHAKHYQTGSRLLPSVHQAGRTA